MEPCELTVGMAALANAIAEGKSESELSQIVLALCVLKDNLNAIALQRALKKKETGVA